MSDESLPIAYIVRHGATRSVGEFAAAEGFTYARGDKVILKSERGLEHGEVLCASTPKLFEMLPDPTRGQLLRRQTPDDVARIAEIKAKQPQEFDTALAQIRKRRLQMDLIDVEHLFGHDRIVLYFISEKRIDFRDLVKDLAKELQARIELRQIGVRDEAKLKADYGDCGKPVCCNTHMIQMPPVSMRMAKLQKSTLDPTKISGRCGRLKCCLRFEQDVYEEHQKSLPPVGARIVTDKGKGRVLYQEVLARRVLVEFEDGRRLPVQADEVLSRI